MDHNPLHKDSAIDREFIQRCKQQDPEGHDFFLNPESNDQLNSSDDELVLSMDEAQIKILQMAKSPMRMTKMKFINNIGNTVFLQKRTRLGDSSLTTTKLWRYLAHVLLPR